MFATALALQLVLLAYHQATTFIDLHPFNGARHYQRRERLAECLVNGVLMSLAPLGFIFHIGGLMAYGAIYYFVLFAIELVIWWVPYLTQPRGAWRGLYNKLLALATSEFAAGDTLSRWLLVYQRIHRGTITPLPLRTGRPTPNLEHLILQVLTLATAIASMNAWLAA